MHQNRFLLELRPRPHWGSLQRSLGPVAGFRGPYFKGTGWEGRGGKEGWKKWRERKKGGKGA